jgi:hypothetical protein
VGILGFLVDVVHANHFPEFDQQLGTFLFISEHLVFEIEFG